MARKRVFLTGSERAEWEHIHGPLAVDPVDSRFVLVDDETEQAIRDLPNGVPIRQGQDPSDKAKIREAELAAFDKGGNAPEGDEAVAESGKNVKANK